MGTRKNVELRRIHSTKNIVLETCVHRESVGWVNTMRFSCRSKNTVK
jgi:hypothetical protein